MYSFKKHILLFAPYIFIFLFAISRQFYVKSFWSAICFQIKLLANYSNYVHLPEEYLFGTDACPALDEDRRHPPAAGGQPRYINHLTI